MAVRSGFFNSVNGDRKYDAARFAEYFASFIGNGVFPQPSDGLQVVANNDMTVTVKAGKAWINGYILINDDDYVLRLDPADGVLNRIDRVVVRYDVEDREIRIEVKKGTFSDTPVPPALQRDVDAYELALADIYVRAGAVNIIQDDITDLRGNKELCGRVDSLIAGDVSTLAALLDLHLQNKGNPHAVTAAQVGAAPASHVGSGGSAHALATTSSAGFMSAADKVKLESIETGATKVRIAKGSYVGDGTDNRIINVGFKPTLLFLDWRTGTYNQTVNICITWDNIEGVGIRGSTSGVVAREASSGHIPALQTVGFKVSYVDGQGLNEFGKTYNWTAIGWGGS